LLPELIDQQWNINNIGFICFYNQLFLEEPKSECGPEMTKTISIRTAIGFTIWIAAVSGSARDFSAIDRHALNTPESVEFSVESLAGYLIRPATDDTEKIRALFRWITANIRYDNSSTGSPSIRFSNPNDVLKIRSAVCDGYATLFESLGRASGLEVVKISGFAKGYGYTIGDSVLYPPNHSWNAIRLNGEWHLLDATWGAGYLDENGRFNRAFDEHFFLTDPKELIATHLPADPRWQLINPPVSEKTFIDMPLLKPAFFRHRLRLNNHSPVRCNDQVIIRLGNPQHSQLSGRLILDGKTLDESLLFIQNENSDGVIRVGSPGQGSFILRIFARGAHDQGEFEWALDFLLKCQSDRHTGRAFPLVYSSFQQHQARLFEPVTGKLQPGRPVRFELLVPGAETVSIIQGHRWIPMEKKGGRFIKTITAQPGLLKIGSRFPGEKRYDILLEYRVQK
jgi:hypothetical protein